MKINIILLILITLGFNTRLFSQYDTRFINQTFENSKGLNEVQKIEFISNALLGKSYQDGPLGEGKSGEFDADPLFRFDKFDCTTFVETVLAFALSNNIDDFFGQMNEIRYKGEVSFLNRNHFISLDWINDNKNIVYDATYEVSRSTLLAKATIQKTKWYQKMDVGRIQGFDIDEARKLEKLEKLKLLSNLVEDEIVSLPYISIDNAIEDENLKKIPSGSIINIVRPNWDIEQYIGTNINVSHQGFAIRINGKVFFRHASSKAGKVSDILLKDYLKPYLNHKTVKGINILKLY